MCTEKAMANRRSTISTVRHFVVRNTGCRRELIETFRQAAVRLRRTGAAPPSRPAFRVRLQRIPTIIP